MRRAVRTKWRWMGAFWLVQAGLAFLLWPMLASNAHQELTIDNLVSEYSNAGYMTSMGVVVLCVMVLQAAFLMPVRKPRASGGSWRSRVAHHAISGAAIAVCCGLVTLLGLGALVGAAEVFNIGIFGGDANPVWFFWIAAGVAWPAATACLAVYCRRATPVWISMMIAGLSAGLLLSGLVLGLWTLWNLTSSSPGGDAPWFTAAAVLAGVSWAVGTPLLISFARWKAPHTALGRVASRLLIGTIVEAAAVIPLDVMARRKTDCYCGEGTLWSLTICWAVGSLVLGPAVWLLPLSRRRRRWYRGRCVGCGYDVSGCPGAERCPECGLGWRASETP